MFCLAHRRFARWELALLLCFGVAVVLITPLVFASTKIALSSFGASNSAVAPQGQADFIRQIPPTANDVVYSPSTKLLYASVPSQTPGLQFPLGQDLTFGRYRVNDLAVAPGSPNLVAVASGANYQRGTELVESSRKAIIETGFSERYFYDHFRLVNTFDKPGDIRVVWKFSVNEYDASVIDSIGYYTENQKRKYIHSIKNTLGSTRDISKTIPRPRAEALMNSCLGNYAGEAVVLMRLSPGERASLYLAAHTVSETENNVIRKRESDEQTNQQGVNTDEPEREPTHRLPPIYLGYIDLETGKCSKGRGIAKP
jgi:hypothetical protein